MCDVFLHRMPYEEFIISLCCVYGLQCVSKLVNMVHILSSSAEFLNVYYSLTHGPVTVQSRSGHGPVTVRSG